MATIRTNFKDKIQTKKGAWGEDIICDYLQKKGYTVYRPVTEGPHPFDMLVAKDKKHFFICEVKAKSKMSKRPETGVNLRNFHDYEVAQKETGIPVCLFFVDEDEGAFYGNTLAKLEIKRHEKERKEPYPYVMTCKNGQVLRLWHRNSMVTCGKIPEEKIGFLYEASTRNYPQPSEVAQ